MKIFKRLAALCLAGVMALGAVTLSGCGCSSVDRSDVATFFPFRPNTIFVFEHTMGEHMNQVMFFDHIDGNAAQRTFVAGTENTGINSYVEILTMANNAVISTTVGANVNRNNYLEELTTSPIVLLDGPLSVGATWRAQYGVIGGGMVTSVVSLNTRVRVPYGTFRALELRTVGRFGSNTSETDFYAPGIGLVKRVTLIGQPDGSVVRHEMVLVDIIENVGMNEIMAIFFPNNGEIEVTYAAVTHYTNSNAVETYLAAANQVWREFGFEIDPAWLNRVDEIADGGMIFPQFDFNEQFLEAMNQVANAETEELILWSLAATLSGVFSASARRTDAIPFNPNEVYITINNRGYESNRVQIPLSERIIIFEAEEVEEEEYEFAHLWR